MSIKLENVSYQYSQNSASKHDTLKNISLEINRGEFVALVGHTGSGKSTLVQHLNGLLKATEGAYYFDGEDVYGEKYNRKLLRSKVGMTFQYPEHQLFESTVLKDVCFGPMNMGLTEEEATREAKKALEAVGIAEKHYHKSPFELSGGQKRRVAIAGVLAMNPEYFILDEPTAGLDPRGRRKILNLIKKLHEERGMAILLVSHCMEDVAEYADRILVLRKGQLVCDGAPKEIFANRTLFEEKGLLVPEAVSFMDELNKSGFCTRRCVADGSGQRDCFAITVDEAKDVILRMLKKGGWTPVAEEPFVKGKNQSKKESDPFAERNKESGESKEMKEESLLCEK